ncbi:MAG TPA: acetyl-CoA carboxylase biotin carboxylase subunit, partial [Candidatus Limnocylindrales bacterium]|nr:acetyl-CoA carboxylase biotin carboxylase subunit [Candidatus Limnocylindrales bacterium]
MFERILIANRGEIALRVLRTCREMGISAVVAYSEADRDSRAVQLADEAICVGPAEARRSYLSAAAILSAAIVSGCDAIHPGYGFLAEDDSFAEMTRAHGLTFIGPPPEVLERFASKAATRGLLARHGLPTVPGSEGPVRDDEQARAEAERIGYPILIKPSAGGGGRGMRMVRSVRELDHVLPICRSEALASFGNDTVYLEKWLDENHHVEVQVLVDRFGRGVHVGERDCSVQRRHQKVVEESPSPVLSPAAREVFCEAAITAVTAAGYENVGTLEFLVDRAGNPYFIEINCRIQVEHPVTEMRSGIDLVREQIRIAAGEPLGYGQADVDLRGYAIELRINAEDVANDFRPQAGTVERYLPPGGPGVRMDSHLFAGYEVPPYYDSLLGKLVVWGPDRGAALARARSAIDELVIDGVITNAGFHRALLHNETFLRGAWTTQLLDRVGSAAFMVGSGGAAPTAAAAASATAAPDGAGS